MVETERTQEAAGSSTPCGPGVWLVGSQGPARAARLGEIMRSIDVEGARTFATDCERPFPLAFEPAKDLLLQLVLVIEQEAPYLLVEFGPELLALLPELGKRSYLREVPGLNLIALGGTKRRLHKDSEQLFRLVYAFASLVLEAKINCPSLAHRPLAIVLDNFDAADRLTVSCIFHLWQRLGNAEVRIVIAAPDPAGPEGERPWLWADDHRTGLSAQAAGLTDAYAEHNVLLRQVLESLHPAATRLDVLGAPGSAREAEGDTDAAELGRRLRTLSLAGQTRVQLRCLGAEDELARQMVGEVSPADLAVGDALLTMGGRDDTVPPLTPGSPRLARRLLRDTIAPETRRRLHAAIAERLARHKGRGEGALVPLAYHLLRGDNRPAGLDYALQEASAGLGFSLNYESILFCCRELLRHTEGVP